MKAIALAVLLVTIPFPLLLWVFLLFYWWVARVVLDAAFDWLAERRASRRYEEWFDGLQMPLPPKRVR